MKLVLGSDFSLKFILEKKEDYVDIDVRIVEDVIRSCGRRMSYIFCDIENMDSVEDLAKYIPVGDIPFVKKWLKITHGIETINPIEIPKELRKKEFLKRSYRVVPYAEIPRNGRYFIKDVSDLKQFSYEGDLANFDFSSIDNSHLYQVSELFNIAAEYRIYVIDGNVDAICQYNGNGLAVCDPRYLMDRGLILKAKMLYTMQEDYPNSYTMDIMVGKEGTCICEIHPFVSVGLYSSIWGTNLLYAYKDGINYILNHNTAIEPFEV